MTAAVAASLVAAFLAGQARPAASPQGVQALARAGRTYVTFADATAAPSGEAPLLRLVEQARAQRTAQRRSFLVEVIDPSAPETPVEARVIPPLSAFNTARAGRRPAPQDRAPRYAVTDGAPLSAGRGLAVFVPARAARRCYRVFQVDGARRTPLGEACVDEEPGPGDFVLQRRVEGARLSGVPTRVVERFVRWEAPPHANRLRAIDYLVAVPRARPPPERAPGAGLYLHAWGGDVESGYGVWHEAKAGALLLASNQDPYDWWSGYHELVDVDVPGDADAVAAAWRKGVVQPYTARRLLAFVDWAVQRYGLDERRLFIAGSSMGGTGATALLTRAGERFAWVRSDVGVHVPRLAPAYHRSFAAAWGRPIPFADHDAAAAIARSPERSLPLLVFANGTNDEHVGWAQAVTLLRALQEARQPHVFAWGEDGHRERARLPGGARRDLPVEVATTSALPAFTRCSLDDDAGPVRDSPAPRGRGQVNLWLLWDVPREDATSLSVRVWLSAKAPRAEAVVDVTPRRAASLRPRPGERFSFVNETDDGTVVDTQELTVDEHGRLTALQTPVRKQGSVLRFIRQEP